MCHSGNCVIGGIAGLKHKPLCVKVVPKSYLLDSLTTFAFLSAGVLANKNMIRCGTFFKYSFVLVIMFLKDQIFFGCSTNRHVLQLEQWILCSSSWVTVSLFSCVILSISRWRIGSSEVQSLVYAFRTFREELICSWITLNSQTLS